MKIPKIICWYCGKEIATHACSRHHFFNHDDIKIRLRRIFGDPNTDDEHKNMSKMIHIIHANMPQFLIHQSCHKELEAKLK